MGQYLKPLKTQIRGSDVAITVKENEKMSNIKENQRKRLNMRNDSNSTIETNQAKRLNMKAVKEYQKENELLEEQEKAKNKVWEENKRKMENNRGLE